MAGRLGADGAVSVRVESSPAGDASVLDVPKGDRAAHTLRSLWECTMNARRIRKTDMAIELEKLLQLRPVAYHTTGRLNFTSIKEHRALISTKSLVDGSTYTSLLLRRRVTSTTIRTNSGDVQIRDQRPLRPGSLHLQRGTTLQGYLDELNRRVFLWPGTVRGPVFPGRSHFDHYHKEDGVVVLRMPLRSLLAANASGALFVEKCNSGAARHHGGRPVERGPNTFCLLRDASFPASDVVEFSFIDRVDLPLDTNFSTALEGPWHAFT